jgi:hypothetical protein
VTFNLTGGTKMMALAAFSLAAQTGSRFVYLENRGSRLQRYRFEAGAPVREEPLDLPELITAEDYLKAHLDGYTEDGFSRDEQGKLTDGGQFEEAVYLALETRLDDVLPGVRPARVARQIEIDLVLRAGNKVGIAEVKLGSQGLKRGLDQLKMAGEPTYLGTYTAQFLITAAVRLPNPIRTLARERGVHVIQAPGYQAGRPLTKADADRLAADIRRVLAP